MGLNEEAWKEVERKLHNDHGTSDISSFQAKRIINFYIDACERLREKEEEKEKSKKVFLSDFTS